MYLQKFKDEIEQVVDDKFRDFVVEALTMIEDDYYSETDLVTIKKVVHYSRLMLDVLDADDMIFDIFNVVGLLHLSCKWDLGETDIYHMLRVRAAYAPLQSIIGREQYNNILLLIESQEGLHSPIPQVEPRIDDPVYHWILPFAISHAREDVMLIDQT